MPTDASTNPHRNNSPGDEQQADAAAPSATTESIDSPAAPGPAGEIRVAPLESDEQTPGVDVERDAELTTGPLDASTGEEGSNTIPLDESSAGPVPPLEERVLVGSRYRTMGLLGVRAGANVYRVTDTQGHRRCWACGSSTSLPGDMYCVECGAQLTGRYYRMQEFDIASAPGAEAGLPVTAESFVLPVVLDNRVPGLVHVYDTFIDSERARVYIIWEEVSGRAFGSWLGEPGAEDNLMASAGLNTASQLASLEEPEDEQALAWMAQAADILANLHDYDITAMNLNLTTLIVQPGDRIGLIEPSGGRILADPDLQGAAKLVDVRSLAGALEKWYLAVRQTSPDSVPLTVIAPENGQESEAGETTAPIDSQFSPSVVLARARENAYATADEFASALHDLYEASKPVTDMALWSAKMSDVGRVRQINEDSLLTVEATVLEQEGNMPIGAYIVADGMGGHQSGEVASSIAVRTIGSLINSSFIAPLVAGDPVASNATALANLVKEATLEANRRIYELARERRSDLGTTVTVALIAGTQLTVANVGDSRTYLWRDGQLSVITKDHSLVAQLVAAGQLTPEEMYSHPRRNEIYRALGDPHLTANEVDTFGVRLQPGDAVLLCSDGLWDFVRDGVLASVLAEMENQPPEAVCRDLIDRANAAGGEDNISVILVRVRRTQPDSE